MKIKTGYKIDGHSSIEIKDDLTPEQADKFQKLFNILAYKILENAIKHAKEVNNDNR